MGLGDFSSLRAESHWIMQLQCLSPQSTQVWESSLGHGSVIVSCDHESKVPTGKCAAGRAVSEVCWGSLENTHPPLVCGFHFKVHSGSLPVLASLWRGGEESVKLSHFNCIENSKPVLDA